MRNLARVVLLLSSGMLVSTTLAANAPDRPPGVDAEHWVALGTSIGVVLATGDEASAAGKDSPGARHPPRVIGGTDRTLLLAPTSPAVRDAVEHAEAEEPIHGYLMVKQAGIWRRLIVTSP